jgi:hypothetical protein
MYPHNAMWIHNSDTHHNNGSDHTLTLEVCCAPINGAKFNHSLTRDEKTPISAAYIVEHSYS